MTNRLIALAAAAYAIIGIAAALRSPGSPAISLSFVAAFGALLFLAFPRPRLYVYTCIAILLFLGFAVKFIALHVFDFPLNEPTGLFANRPAEWDRALLGAAAGAAGLVLVRIVQLWLMRHSPRPVTVVPDFYPRFRVPLWILAAVAFAVLAAVNMTGSFYQIGLATQMILPLRLHVIASWLVHSGFLLVTALLVAWEMTLRRTSAAPLAAPALEGLTISISALSRSLFILHVMPFALWILGHDEDRPRVHIPRWLVAYGTTFVISIAGVMVARALIFPPRQVYAPETAAVTAPVPTTTTTTTTAAVATTTTTTAPPTATPAVATNAPVAAKPSAPAKPPVTATAPVASTATSPVTSTAKPTHPLIKTPPPKPPSHRRLIDATTRQQAYFATLEVGRLVIGRWIGLEGALAVAAQDRLSPELFLYVIREDAGRGVNTTYQRVAGAQYQPSTRFTFLTLAGFIGVMLFSGSMAVIFACSTAVAVVLTAIELLALRALRAPVAAGAIGVMLANAICQMNFPYLTMILAVQQIVAVALAGVVLRLASWGWRRSGRDSFPVPHSSV